MKNSLDCDYVQLSIVGKDIPHFHIHLIPRTLNDDLIGWPTFSYQGNEMLELAEKIKSGLK
jgi:diadenosine tetraphosphate (Ap4A) HIT family hydrolase